MKPIILTQEAKDNALEIFKNLLNSIEGDADLKINITTETLLLKQGVEKPTVYVTASAYMKMMSLIKNSSKELAWYGITSRINSNYIIEDILVYPQTVTSVTVDADEVKCAKWFMELPDETINNLKFQGHSHVGMSASPSGRDTNNWQQFANLLKPNEFMILCIGNNKGEFYWNIYDKSINVLFENKDITMTIIDDKGNSISDWAKESVAKYIVDEKPIVISPNSIINQPSIFYSDESKLSLNGHQYAAASTTPKNTTYKEMLKYVPSDLKGEVDYEPEIDTYFTDVIGIPGFTYNHLYACYVCEGAKFRREHSKQPVGRPKKEKENKEQVRKGVR
jgi:hypothetical protein